MTRETPTRRQKASTAGLAALLIGLALPIQALSADASAPQEQAQASPEFTDAFLKDEANIAMGEELWAQCRHCHGRSAYPGKAPKLTPRRYKPSFVYNRVTNGFRKMPPWKDVYTDEQRMAIVAYILSPRFSP